MSYRIGIPKEMDPAPAGRWVRVSGGDLPLPIDIRIDHGEGGRFVVSGVLIGREDVDRQEITWRTLRDIKLAAILDQLFRGFDPLQPGKWASNEEQQYAWVSLWEDFVRPAQSVETSPTRGPSRSDLADFARTYLKHKAAHPNRAMTATAKELNISRATAIRRADAARKEGLLP